MKRLFAYLKKIFQGSTDSLSDENPTSLENQIQNFEQLQREISVMAAVGNQDPRVRDRFNDALSRMNLNPDGTKRFRIIQGGRR